MRSVCVFCGSGDGNRPQFLSEANELGRELATASIKVIYGGCKTGLMGSVADGALAAGGNVVGVLPHFLKHKEVAHPKLTKLFYCNTLAERKQMMFELSDAYIVLPGGFGTMDELFEVLTYNQLQQIQAPVFILNSGGYYDHLIALFTHMESTGLIRFGAQKYAHFMQNYTEIIDRVTTVS